MVGNVIVQCELLLISIFQFYAHKKIWSLWQAGWVCDKQDECVSIMIRMGVWPVNGYVTNRMGVWPVG